MHQLGPACAHRHAQARALASCRGVPAAVSQALARPYRGLGRPYRSAQACTLAQRPRAQRPPACAPSAPAPSARLPACLEPSTPAHLRLRAPACAPRTPRAPTSCRGLGCALCCNTTPSLHLLVTIQPSSCNTTQPASHLTHNTALSIAIHSSPTACCNTIPFHCNTLVVLQYNFLPCFNTIQPPLAIHLTILQYNFSLNQPPSSPPRLQYKPCLAIQWAVAQSFTAQFFFLSFFIIVIIIIIINFSIISSYWKYPKKNTYS